MAGTIEERLGRLERRLLWIQHDLRQVRRAAGIHGPIHGPDARVRTSTREPAQPEPEPASRAVAPVRQPPVPRPAAPRKPPPLRKSAPARDWERFFGMAVLGRIGVAAVLLAAAYFAKLAYVQMSNELRVVSIYALAALFVGVGFILRTRVAPTYVALLWGGGAAAAYLAGVAARLRYDLVDAFPALLMLLGASILGQYLARRVKLQAFASVALAGAFAAPLLIASPTADRTALMVYLLALHGWSAWVQRAWGWQSARYVGIAGTLVVGGLWLLAHGALDASTYLHVELYLLGLIAPEVVRVVRRIPVDREAQWLVACAAGLGQAWLLIEASRVPAELARMPLLVCAIMALALVAGSVALVRRAAAARNRHMVRNLARVGWIALAFATFWLVRTGPADLTVRPATLALVLLAAISVCALALRTRLGVGELGALAASILAAAVIVDESLPHHTFALLPIALVGPAALLWTSRRSWIRCAAAWAGLTAVTFALAEGFRWDDDWIAGAIAGCALWIAAAYAAARRHTDHGLARNATAGLLLVGLVWFNVALEGGRTFGHTFLINAVTGAGLVLAAVAGSAAAWLRTRPRRGWSTLPTLLWIYAGLTLLALGGRETMNATRELAKPVKDALLVLYLSGFAVALAQVGRWQRQRVVPQVGLLLAGCAAVLAFQQQIRPMASAWVVLSVLAPAAAVVAITMCSRARDRLLSWGAVFGLGLVAAAWGAHVHAGRFPLEHAVLNLRFLTALGILASACAVHRSNATVTLRRETGSALLLGGAAFGFVVGLLEVWKGVHTFDGAWPDVLVSVYATLFAAAVLIVGFLRTDTRLRYAALGLFGCVVVKVGLHDLATADRPLRIFVTGVLGLVLLAAAFAYARRTEEDTGRKEPLTPTPH